MEICPICGKDSYRKWTESVEVWGSWVHDEHEECVNPNCGEESEDESE